MELKQEDLLNFDLVKNKHIKLKDKIKNRKKATH